MRRGRGVGVLAEELFDLLNRLSESERRELIRLILTSRRRPYGATTGRKRKRPRLPEFSGGTWTECGLGRDVIYRDEPSRVLSD